MKFYLWMNSGEGCDYTIGCGQVLEELKGATTIEEARAMVPEMLSYYGINDDDRRRLSAALILVERETAMGLVGDRLVKLRAEAQERERARKRAELERLKRELGEP